MTNTRDLLGRAVRDSRGRRLGSVEDFVVDRITGRVSFVLVDLDEHGDELMPVPWSALTVALPSRQVRLPLGARSLAGAPRVAADHLDELERRDVKVEICSYYGVQPPGYGA